MPSQSALQPAVSREALVKTVPHNLNGDRLAILYETWSRLTYLGKPLDGERYELVACQEAKAIVYAPLPHAKDKAGLEKEEPLWNFYKGLLRKLKFHKLKRVNMTTALHPNGTGIAVLYTEVQCCKHMPLLVSAKIPTMVVLDTLVDADRKRKIALYSEHYCETQEEALQILQDFHYWPDDTFFLNYSFSGEVSKK